MRRIAPCLVLLLAACSATPPPRAELPRDAVDGASDPTRAAILGSAYAFGTPSSIAGRPDAAARAVAQVEYLATELPAGPRWVEYSPVVGIELQGARSELRQALGIAPDATPQTVVDGLYAASRAWQRGDRTAAAQALTEARASDAPRALLRLASLPPLPRTSTATALAQQELWRVDQDSRFGANGGNDGGKN